MYKDNARSSSQCDGQSLEQVGLVGPVDSGWSVSESIHVAFLGGAGKMNDSIVVNK